MIEKLLWLGRNRADFFDANWWAILVYEYKASYFCCTVEKSCIIDGQQSIYASQHAECLLF
jgi:hypothetical protein